MADISKVVLPGDNTVYNLKDANAAPLNRGVEYIRGTWSSASGAWTGETADASLYDEKKIMLFLPFGGSGEATLNLTLSGGTTTGAKNVYLSGTTRVTTEFDQHSHILLVYHSALNIDGTNYEGWWCAPEGGSSGEYEIYADPAAAVGSVLTGDAIAVEANYTPSGDILTTSKTISSVVRAYLQYSYTEPVLAFEGIELASEPLSVITGATFVGSGVNLVIREKKDPPKSDSATTDESYLST